MSARSSHLLNRGLLLAMLGIVVWLVLTIPTRTPPADQAPTAPARVAGEAQAPPVQIMRPGGALLVPVAGVAPAALTDTFSDARGTGRTHNAIDIMAPRGTPVLAAAEGSVEKLHFSEGGGGISVYVRSPDRRWSYYYAHLDRYAPGLAEGQQIRPGTVLGFVGSTGSANPEGPHLHFAVNSMAPGERWWQGTPINPYPLLAGSSGR